MNYSDCEHYGTRIDDELVEAGVQLLPLLAPALFGAVTHLAQSNNLTSAQMKVILQVGSRGKMTMGEIACGLSVSLPATSEIVDRLVDAGHLVRSTDPADRRRVLITPTPESLRMSEAMNDLRRAQVRLALDRLAPEDRPAFIRSLEALLNGLTSIEATRPSPCPADVPPDRPSSTLVRTVHPVAATSGAANGAAGVGTRRRRTPIFKPERISRGSEQ